jgi:hypothetical protein
MAIERQIPFFIRARSPMGLRRSMIMNNAKHGLTFHYFDIQFVQGSWYAWFYKSLDKLDSQDVEELEQDGTST